ncbi:hypothetical protein HDU84_004457 [Entophlyctis sp. JEL0112]|nr:hypothetical protein HDU84_004457 [Entophlyctis sp. JEL0112]
MNKASNSQPCSQAVLDAIVHAPFTHSVIPPSLLANCSDPRECKVEWIVYASRCTLGLNRLANLVSNAGGMKFTVLGMGVEWYGWAQRIRTYHDYIATLNADALVVVTDADDVVLVPGCDGREIIEGYLRRDGSVLSPVLFGSERLDWPPTPDSDLMQQNLVWRPQDVRDPRKNGRLPPGSPPDTPYPPPSIFKFLNAGSFVARAGDVRRLITNVYTDGCLDDQIEFGKAYMHHPLAYYHLNPSAAAQVRALESSLTAAALAEKQFGTHSPEHLLELQRVYDGVIAKMVSEAGIVGEQTRVTAGNFSGYLSADNVPAHARPLIALDHDADLILNVGGITVKSIVFENATKRITVKRTGGRPCIVHQPGKKTFNRPIEELSKMFGLDWDEVAIQKAAELLKKLSRKEADLVDYD